MKLTGLKIEGLRKIKAAELDFDGTSLIQIRGRNQAGKSTVIDAILMLLKGARFIPADAVTHGVDKSVIVGKIDEYVIKRTIKPDGSSLLSVESETGKVPKPQEFLDKISGQFIDPEWFARLPSAEKRSTVMRYAGIDFTEIDRKIAEAEQNRLILGRELKALGAIPPEPEKAEEVSITDLLAERKKIEDFNRDQDDKDRANRDAVIAVRRDIVALFEGVEYPEPLADAIRKAESVYRDRGLADLVPLEGKKSTDEVDGKIANIEAINAKARKYTEFLEKKKSIEAKKAEYDTADANVEALRKEKDDMVKNAKLPVEGLTITDTGLAFRGATDENWSDSEALKIAIKIAVAWSGDVRAVYIKRGEAFDTKSLAMLKQYADAMDFQVIVEIVDDSYAKEGDGVIYIDEGEVVSQ